MSRAGIGDSRIPTTPRRPFHSTQLTHSLTHKHISIYFANVHTYSVPWGRAALFGLARAVVLNGNEDDIVRQSVQLIDRPRAGGLGLQMNRAHHEGLEEDRLAIIQDRRHHINEEHIGQWYKYSHAASRSTFPRVTAGYYC